jgi:hypothetical protein
MIIDYKLEIFGKRFKTINKWDLKKNENKKLGLKNEYFIILLFLCS